MRKTSSRIEIDLTSSPDISSEVPVLETVYLPLQVLNTSNSSKTTNSSRQPKKKTKKPKIKKQKQQKQKPKNPKPTRANLKKH